LEISRLLKVWNALRTFGQYMETSMALIFFYYVPELEAITETNADYISEPGIYLSIVSVIFLILANRFIRKDEKLIRSADRLR